MSADEFEILPSQKSEQINDEGQVVHNDPDLIASDVQLVNSEPVSLEASDNSHNSSEIQKAMHSSLMESAENDQEAIENSKHVFEEVMNVPSVANDDDESSDSDMNMEQTPPQIVSVAESIEIQQSYYNNDAKDQEEEEEEGSIVAQEGIQPTDANANKIYDNPYLNGCTPGDDGGNERDGEVSDAIDDDDDIDLEPMQPLNITANGSESEESNEEKERVSNEKDNKHNNEEFGDNEMDANRSKNNIYLNLTLIFMSTLVLFMAYYIGYYLPSNRSLPPKADAPKLHCPPSIIYVPLDGSAFHINASHPDHAPHGTYYEWDIIDVMKHDDLLVDGEDSSNLLLLSTSAATINIDLHISCTTVNNYVFNKECSIQVMFHEIPYFGIDLGTTYSCIAYQDRQSATRETKIVVVDKNRAEHCIPTAVYYEGADNGVIIGEDALKKLATDPLNVIFDVKRIVGRSCDDSEISLFNDSHAFNVVCDSESDRAQIFVANLNEYIYAEQALAVILGHLVEIASFEFGVPYIGDVVVSIPALFHNGQRKAIRSAAELVGLKVKQLVVEPTAAALAYSYYSSSPTDNFKLFLTFDFGGGTIDCSVMRCTGVDCQVLSVKGNSSLGGIDFDHVLREIMVEKYRALHGWDNIQNDERLNAKFLKVAERVKKSLSVSSQHQVTMINGDKEEKKQIVITRKEFEQHPQTIKLVDSAIFTAKSAMDYEGIKASNIRMILMIGGTTKIPMIQKRLREEFGSKERLKLVFPKDDAQLMVVKGSAVIGASLAFANDIGVIDKQIVLEDVIPLSLGFSICLTNYNNSQETKCGIMDVIIEKNSHYPTRSNVIYCQKDPISTVAKLHLYEGDHEFVTDNYLLSHLSISNIPKRNANVCDSIIVEFIIDKNGIAQIQAIINDKNGNKTSFYSKLSVASNDGNLSKQQIQIIKRKMIPWFKGHNAIQNALSSN